MKAIKLFVQTKTGLVVSGIAVLFLFLAGVGISNNTNNSSGVDTNSAAYKEAQQQIQERQAAILKAGEAEDAAKNAVWLQTPAGKICAAHPGWTQAVCTSISRQQISLGMTKEQVTLAIGSPDNVNTTTTVNGSREQWVYGYDYIYFEDGILASVQQHK